MKDHDDDGLIRDGRFIPTGMQSASPDRDVLYDWWAAEVAATRRHEAVTGLLHTIRVAVAVLTGVIAGTALFAWIAWMFG
jgi:hypothetical protein